MGDTPYQPLTGDPDVLKTKATHYLAIADAIKRSVVTLNKIHDDTDGQVSEAVDAMRDMAHDVSNDINKAHDRYEKTAQALLTYSGKLREAQSDATTAISNINAKQTAYDHAHTAAHKANENVENASDDDKSSAKSKAKTAAGNLSDAQTALDNAHGAWHDAVDKKNTAAQAAIKMIVDVVDHHNNGLKNPSWWDKFVSIVEKIGDIAGVLAIFLSWVPVLGEVLLVIAAVAAIVKLVDSVVKVATGEGTWLGVLGAAVGCVLTLFGGRIFTFLGKAARIKGLARVPKMVGGVRNEANAMLKAQIGKRLMKSATKDLFKLPTRADFTLRSMWTKALASGGEERAAYKALFTGGADKLKALRTLAGVDNNVLKAVQHDISHHEFNALTSLAAFHQLQSLWNKGADIVNVPSSIHDIITGDDGKTAPDANITHRLVDLADKYTPTFKSYN